MHTHDHEVAIKIHRYRRDAHVSPQRILETPRRASIPYKEAIVQMFSMPEP